MVLLSLSLCQLLSTYSGQLLPDHPLSVGYLPIYPAVSLHAVVEDCQVGFQLLVNALVDAGHELINSGRGPTPY